MIAIADVEKLISRCRQAVEMRPALPIGVAVALGDVGFVEDGKFRFVGNVATLLGERAMRGYETRKLEGVHQAVSGRDVTVHALAEGKPSEAFADAGVVRARAELRLAKAESFLLVARDVTVRTMPAPERLFHRILAAVEEGAWDPELVIVYEVGIARHLTAVLARQPATTLLLAATRPEQSGPSELQELVHGWRLRAQSPFAECLVGANTQPAFFNAYRLHDRWREAAARRQATAEPVPPAPDKAFARV